MAILQKKKHVNTCPANARDKTHLLIRVISLFRPTWVWRNQLAKILIFFINPFTDQTAKSLDIKCNSSSGQNDKG